MRNNESIGVMRSLFQSPPVVVKVAFAAEIVLALLYITVMSASSGVHESAIELVDLNGEGNLPSWFSSAQLLLVSLLYTVLWARGKQDERRYWGAAIAAVLFLVLSIDETAQLHERFGQISDALLPGGSRENTLFWRTGIGNCLLAFVATVMIFGVRWWFGRGFSFRGKRKIFFGLVVFLFSASAPEILSNFVASRGMLVAERVVEEIGEMAGITLVLWGTTQLLGQYGIVWRIQAGGRKED